ncbi:putative nuclease HARBI1 [Ambystoma mexicanum]|uniref:putative nuclease HARBI1 n=1 Tax=Ambystoma mexicanum TaxID=8296 RepID=UPI0037E914DC
MAAFFILAIRRRRLAELEHDLAIERRRRRGERVFRNRITIFNMTEGDIVKRYHLSSKIILDLLNELKPDLEPATSRTHAVPAHVKLLCSLHFLASGSYQSTVAAAGGISQPTFCRVLKQVLSAIVKRAGNVIYFPKTKMEMSNMKEDFYNLAGFPNVIGVVDCTHIAIAPPSESEHIFRNSKMFHSINIQLICDANNLITNAVVKYPGSTQDAFIFEHSSVCLKLKDNVFGDGWLLGDTAYSLRPWILTPFAEPCSPAQQAYNKTHSLTRSVMQRTLGILKCRLRCLDHSGGGALQYSPDTACQIILACCMLHNLALRSGMQVNANEVLSSSLEIPLREAPPDDSEEGIQIREQLLTTVFTAVA